MAKRQRTNNYLRNTTQKTKDLVSIRTPLKTGRKLSIEGTEKIKYQQTKKKK